MGTNCALWQVVSETMDDLRADPSIGQEVIDDLRAYNEELPDDQKIYLDVGITWDVLSFIFKKNGVGPFPAFLKEGGNELEAIEQGKGNGREFDSDDTYLIYKALESKKFPALCKGITTEDLVKAEVYPFTTDEVAEDVLGSAERTFDKLMEFLKDTVARKRGILTYLY